MKTTKKEFELFVSESKKWINKIELNNWSLYFSHKEIGENVYSEIRRDLDGYTATIYMNTEFEMTGIDDITQAIKDTAKHEIMHLLVSRLSLVGKNRFVSGDELYQAEEELVTKLEKLL